MKAYFIELNGKIVKSSKARKRALMVAKDYALKTKIRCAFGTTIL